MTPVEIMALIFIIAASIKTAVILVSPKSWANFVKKVWAVPSLVMIVSLILAIISLYFLMQELSIIQVFAVILFISFLAATGIAVYSKEVIALMLKLLKDRNIVKKSWLYIIIWIVLLIWGISKFFV